LASISVPAVARYAYKKHNDDEVSFRKGETMEVLEKHGSGWFVVRLDASKEMGLCPGNYVRVRKEVLAQRMSPREKTSPRKEKTSPRKEKTSPRKEKTSPRKGFGSPQNSDDEHEDAPPPALPGPPPLWSDTIAGKEAQKIAQQLKIGGDKSPREKKSPRSIMDVDFAQRLSGRSESCKGCGEQNHSGFKHCESCGRPN
jgi:hypothetical protein